MAYRDRDRPFRGHQSRSSSTARGRYVHPSGPSNPKDRYQDKFEEIVMKSYATNSSNLGGSVSEETATSENTASRRGRGRGGRGRNSKARNTDGRLPSSERWEPKRTDDRDSSLGLQQRNKPSAFSDDSSLVHGHVRGRGRGGRFSSYNARGDFSKTRRGSKMSRVRDAGFKPLRDESWLPELEVLECRDLVIKLENNLKTFQYIINQQLGKGSKDLRVITAIVRLLTSLAECEVELKEAANRILAECLHPDRCEGFHRNIMNSALFAVRVKSNQSCNFLLMLARLCCSLLGQFHWDAYSVLPVNNIQMGLMKFAVSDGGGGGRFLEAADNLKVRVENIKHEVKALHKEDGEEGEDAGYTYQLTSILPDLDELTSSEVPEIPSNIVEGHYRSWNHYYDTQFHLLREDFVRPLRTGISDYFKGFRGRDLQDIRVYRDVVIIRPYLTQEGVQYAVKFDTSRLGYVQWNRTKRLIYGSLVCLLSNDSKDFILASVSRREANEVSNGFIVIKPEGENVFIPWNRYTTYTMIESSAYFEAYRHILKSLQKAEITTMPFKQYLVDMKWTSIDQPAYLQSHSNQDEGSSISYDLQSALGCNRYRRPMLAKSVKVTDPLSWPRHSDTELDSSQMEALKMALTQELALIQGPPGTGKTYIGIKIVEALCTNRKVWNPENSSPILVVCFTNHALDQFLKGILQITLGSWECPRIVRVGSRADESMKQYTLRNVRRNLLPDKDYHSLKDLQSQVHAEEKFLAARLDGLQQSSARVEDFHNLSFFMSAHHQEQLLSRWPDEAPDDALMHWLGLLEVQEHPTPPGSDSTFQGDGDHEEKEKWNDDQSDDDEGEMPNGSKGGNSSVHRGSHQKAIDSVSSFHEREVLGTIGQNPSSQLTDRHLPELAGEDVQTSDTWEVYTENETEEPHEADKRNDELTVNVENEAEIEQEQRKLDIEENNESEKPQLPLKMEQVNPKEVPDVKGEFVCVADYHAQVESILHTQPMSENEVQRIADIHQLSVWKRRAMYACWVRTMQFSDIRRQMQDYNALCKEYHDRNQDLDRYAFEHAHVIGMTTTGAAKHQHILHLVKPKIVIIEEAAEVLEAHIVSCLTASTQHLILIGDHQQLRPKPNVYELATKHNLDISLFERLVRNDFPRVTLEIQHRMRPEIAQLVHPLIYPVLENHPSVCNYPNVKGICSNLHFIDHCQLEKPNNELKSHSNIHEAEFMAALCGYLVQQGYKPSQITLLCAYTGQLLEVKKYLPRSQFDGIYIRTLDNYQGEENDIVLLSLVRSNEQHNIGFLRVAHRVCVALSRAKMGFYCIGNFQILEAEADVWGKLVPKLKDRNIISKSLGLCCQNHPETYTSVSKKADFAQVPEGGCMKNCLVRLDCGHTCGRLCHIDDSDHSLYQCRKPCPRTCDLGHPCKLICSRCSGKCPPCYVQVPKLIPDCGHTQTLPCHQPPDDKNIKCKHNVIRVCDKDHCTECFCHNKNDPCTVQIQVSLPLCGHVRTIKCFEKVETVKCYSHCEKKLVCGHQCGNRCHEQCTTECPKVVTKRRKCGHNLEVRCCDNVDAMVCIERCAQILKCGHHCTAFCSEPCTSTCTEQVEVTLPCGHAFLKQCSRSVEKCKCREIVQVMLTCGHTYRKPCFMPLAECMCLIQVSRPLSCGHFAQLPCSADLAFFTCKKNKERTCLPCGHTAKNVRCDKLASYKCEVNVEKNRPCRHVAKVPCHKSKEPLPPCRVPCKAVLACGHSCRGSCTKCFRFRFHEVCSAIVTLRLPCGHTLHNVKCSEQYYAECKAMCPFACDHTKGNKHPCSSPGCSCHLKCSKRCGVSCIHRPEDPCTKMCSDICEVDHLFCDEPCPKQQTCRHPCEGMCGEPCPNMCRKCQQKSKEKKKGKGGRRQQTASFTFQSKLGHEVDLSNSKLRFIQLNCGHIFEVSFMDRHMRVKTSEVGTSQDVKIGMQTCPKCRNVIASHYRYRDVLKVTSQHIQDMPNAYCAARTLQKFFPSSFNDNSIFYPVSRKVEQNFAHVDSPSLRAIATKLSGLRKIPPSLSVDYRGDAFLSELVTKSLCLLSDSVDSLVSSQSMLIRVPQSSVLLDEVLVTVAKMQFFARSDYCWLADSTPQIIHDHLKELWRIQLLSGVMDCVADVVTESGKEAPLKSNRSLCNLVDTLCKKPCGSLSLNQIQAMEEQLKILSDGKFSIQPPIPDCIVPRFRGSTWFRCTRGHLYCRFTAADVDIYRSMQQSCPECAGLVRHSSCKIGK